MNWIFSATYAPPKNGSVIYAYVVKNKIVYAARCDPRDKIWRAYFIKHGEDFRTLKDEDIFCWQYCDWPEPPSSI